MVDYDHFLWFIVAAGSPYTGGYSNSSNGVAYIVFIIRCGRGVLISLLVVLFGLSFLVVV